MKKGIQSEISGKDSDRLFNFIEDFAQSPPTEMPVVHKPMSHHDILSPQHGYDNGDNCRIETISTLTTIPADGNITVAKLEAAKSCWKKALIFYLSYPLDMQSGSHVIPLLASLWTSEGAILELGSSWYSTPMVHRISAVQDRSVLTADSLYAWLSLFICFSSAKHELYLVNDSEKPVRKINDNVHVVQSWASIGQEYPRWGEFFPVIISYSLFSCISHVTHATPFN